MKGKKQLLAVLTVCLLLICAQPVLAAEQWSEQYYRVVDHHEVLTAEERTNIDDHCINVVSAFRVDVAEIIVTPADYEGSTMEAFGAAAYAKGGFGYGPNKDGYMVVYDMENHDMCITGYGTAETLLDADALNTIIVYAKDQLAEYGLWGVMISPPLYIKNILEDMVADGSYMAESAETPAPTELPSEIEPPAGQETSTESPAAPPAESPAESPTSARPAQDGMPCWYPAPGAEFVPFHNDPGAPRVVDEADIFTSEEEAVMLRLIQNIQQTHQKDLVVYTDNTAYGLTHEALASAFYDYCGYGWGDEYEGMCLLFVMDPNDRGFAVWAYGPETQALCSEENAYYLEERLYSFVAPTTSESGEEIPGDYGLGVINFIENINALYSYGYPGAPSWYTGDDCGIQPFHNGQAARVTAELNMLTDAEIRELTARCSALSRQAGIDIAIHVTQDSYWMDMTEYARRLFRSQGYGLHDSYDGVLMLIMSDELAESHSAFLYINGTPLECLTDVNIERMESHVRSENIGTESPYEAAQMWLDDMEHMVRTGRVMPLTGYWVLMVILSLLGGFVLIIIWALFFEGKSIKPKINKEAARYVVPHSLQVVRVGERFLRTRREETYSPVRSDSDSGSSSGSSKSSYNSSYESSSGRTGTTFGRKF